MKRKPPVVLVVDHDRPSRESLHRRLLRAGYEVRCTAEGEDAIYQCDFDPPDVLVLDVDLSDMDGFDVCERVRHDTRDLDLTVIMITDSGNEMVRDYLEQMVEYAGGDYFFARPFDHQAIVQLIDDRHGAARGGRGGRARFPTRSVWPTARC